MNILKNFTSIETEYKIRDIEEIRYDLLQVKKSINCWSNIFFQKVCASIYSLRKS